MAEAIRLELVVVDKTGAALGKAKGNIEGLNRSLGSTRGLAKAAAAALIAFGTGAVVRGVINSIRTFEDLRATLVTIEGSAQAAGLAFDQIKKFTQNTTFQLDEVTNAFITFRNAGLEPTNEFMTNVGNIAAGMGRRLDDVAKAVFNATTGEFEMLKQLGIKVKTEGSKLTVTFKGVTQQIENDGHSIISLIDEIGAKEFAGAIERSSQTLTGAFSNLSDAVAIFANEIGEGGLTSALSQVTRDLTDSVGGAENLARAMGEALGNAILFVRNNIDLLITAFQLLGLLILVKQVAALKVAFAALGVTVGTITTFVRGLTLAMMANPLIAAATVIVGGVILFKDELKGLGETLGIVTKQTEESAPPTISLSALYDDLGQSTSKAGQAYKMMQKAQEQSDASFDKHISKLKDSVTTLGASTDAQKIDLEILTLRRDTIKSMTAEQESEIRGLREKELQLRKLAEAENALPSIARQVGGNIFESPEVTEMKKTIEQLNVLRANDINFEKQYQDSIQIIRQNAARAEADRKKREVEDAVKLIRNGQFTEIDLLGKSNKQKTAIAIGFGKDILNSLAQQNEKAFKIQKALAIAEALIQARSAVVAAYRFGASFGGPIGGAIFAALAAAATAAQISQIRSVQYAGPREKGGPVSGGQSYLVGERGPELFMPNAGGTIVPNSQMGRAVTVNFNIETVDATGFDDLLVERRSTIVGIINEAMNRQGREGITA